MKCIMKCRHAAKHVNVVMNREVPFWDITDTPYCMRLEGKMIPGIHYNRTVEMQSDKLENPIS